AAIGRDGGGLVDLWEVSPIRLEDNAAHTEALIDALFPGNPLLCCGKIPLTCIPSPGFKDFNAVSSGESFTKTILRLCTSKLPFRSYTVANAPVPSVNVAWCWFWRGTATNSA